MKSRFVKRFAALCLALACLALPVAFAACAQEPATTVTEEAWNTLLSQNGRATAQGVELFGQTNYAYTVRVSVPGGEETLGGWQIAAAGNALSGQGLGEAAEARFYLRTDGEDSCSLYTPDADGAWREEGAVFSQMPYAACFMVNADAVLPSSGLSFASLLRFAEFTYDEETKAYSAAIDRTLLLDEESADVLLTVTLQGSARVVFENAKVKELSFSGKLGMFGEIAGQVQRLEDVGAEILFTAGGQQVTLPGTGDPSDPSEPSEPRRQVTPAEWEAIFSTDGSASEGGISLFGQTNYRYSVSGSIPQEEKDFEGAWEIVADGERVQVQTSGRITDDDCYIRTEADSLCTFYCYDEENGEWTMRPAFFEGSSYARLWSVTTERVAPAGAENLSVADVVPYSSAVFDEATQTYTVVVRETVLWDAYEEAGFTLTATFVGTATVAFEDGKVTQFRFTAMADIIGEIRGEQVRWRNCFIEGEFAAGGQKVTIPSAAAER